MNKIVKGIVVGLAAGLLFTGCTNTQNKLDSAISSETTHGEVEKHEAYAKHIKSVKKRKKIEANKQKIDLKKFCFKDNRSIHYKANERCK